MNYEKIISIVREIAPPLSLKSTINDLEKAIRNIGINIFYSDMTHLQEDAIYGFVRTYHNKVDIIVNSSLDFHKRQCVTAELLGYIFLYLNWLPTKTIGDFVYVLSPNNVDIKTKQNLRKFANEFLAPKKLIQSDYKELSGTYGDKITYLSSKYNVSDGLIVVQLFR